MPIPWISDILLSRDKIGWVRFQLPGLPGTKSKHVPIWQPYVKDGKLTIRRVYDGE